MLICWRMRRFGYSDEANFICEIEQTPVLHLSFNLTIIPSEAIFENNHDCFLKK